MPELDLQIEHLTDVGGRTAGLQPAVTYAAPVPVIEYVSPISDVYAAAAPVNEYATPALLVCRQER